MFWVLDKLDLQKVGRNGCYADFKVEGGRATVNTTEPRDSNGNGMHTYLKFL